MNEVQGLSKDALLEKYTPLIRSIASQLKARLAVPVEMDDLMNSGRIGLLEAAERFDSNFGVAFKTFAYYRIKGAMYDELRRMDILTRRKNSSLQFESFANEFLSAETISGSPDLKRTTLKDDAEEIFGLIAGLVPIYFLSLDAANRFAREGKAKTPEEKASFEQEKDLLRQAVDHLTPKERSLIEYHYYQDMTLQQAASKLGLSKSWVSRLHAKALHKLKDAMKRSERKSFP